MISQDRRYTYDESAYGSSIDFSQFKHGLGILNLMKANGCDLSGPAIEIGAGNGLLSVSLAESHSFSDLLITDASSQFVNICKTNVDSHVKQPKNVHFGVFNGDDLDRLPDRSFSLICLANALHHIEKFQDFLEIVSRKLRPGGAFVCQEPFSDGFLMLGVIAKACLSSHKKFSKKAQEKLQELFDTMSNSNRRDIDKSHLEDKHIFNLFEMQSLASRLDMKLVVYPGADLNQFAKDIQDPLPKFSEMVGLYFKYCLNWDESVKKEILQAMDATLRYVDTACSGGLSPAISGVICMIPNRKLAAAEAH